MANKQWPRWVAAVAALAMAGSLPGTALAAPAQGDAASTTPTLSTGNLKSKVSSQLQQAKGEVTAFIQTTSPSALERKNSVLKNFSRQRSALPTLTQRAQSAQAATQRAKPAEKASVNVFSQLQSLDSSAKKIYSTSYALSGVAVRADAASLRKLAEQSGSVAHITILTPKKALDTTNGSGEAPANKNNDQLVNAVKTWEQTGKTGKGFIFYVWETCEYYTHADFGGAGTTEAYQTALNSTADPLTDPKVSNLLDKTKFKGGYDYAGATYNPNAGNNNPTPDANPIDGQGGHHGTHVAGTALGYGVKADGTADSSVDGTISAITTTLPHPLAVASKYEYNDLRQLEKKTVTVPDQNGTQTKVYDRTYTYAVIAEDDGCNRMGTRLASTGYTFGSSSRSFDYTYDAAGNIQTVTTGGTKVPAAAA